MIKSTLVHFIQSLSFSKFLGDFNKYFFHGILLLLISMLYILMCQLLADALFYRHSYGMDFLERLYYITMSGIKQKQVATQLSSFLIYHVYFLYLLRNEKYKTHVLGPKSMECYFIGIGILLGINLFLGHGFTSFVNDRYAYGEYSRNGLGEWINSIIQLIVPMAGSYLGIIFLRRFMQAKPVQNGLLYFFELVFIFYLLALFVSHFSELVGKIFVSPIIPLLRSEFLVYAIAIFFVIVLNNASLILHTYLFDSVLHDIQPVSKPVNFKDSQDVIDQL